MVAHVPGPQLDHVAIRVGHVGGSSGSVEGQLLHLGVALAQECDGGVVVASGPVNSEKEEIVELCAWVFQRGATDAAVTEMTHQDEHGNHHSLTGNGELKVDGDTWEMALARVGHEPI